MLWSLTCGAFDRFARTARHSTKDFQKSQMPRGFARGLGGWGGGGVVAVGIDSYIIFSKTLHVHIVNELMLIGDTWLNKLLTLLTKCHK